MGLEGKDLLHLELMNSQEQCGLKNHPLNPTDKVSEEGRTSLEPGENVGSIHCVQKLAVGTPCAVVQGCLMPSVTVLKFLIIFETEAPLFSFCTGPCKWCTGWEERFWMWHCGGGQTTSWSRPRWSCAWFGGLCRTKTARKTRNGERGMPQSAGDQYEYF